MPSMVMEAWPTLHLEDWRETRDTLHMWTQVVGKVCLALTPHMNHYWNSAFQVTPRGLETPSMTSGSRTFSMAFDFIDHQLVLSASDGTERALTLEPRTVAEFHRLTMAMLREVGVEVHIWSMPVEVPQPVRFEDDLAHHAYDPAAASTFWRILLAVKSVMNAFRCSFIGKCSPVHFFWGSFDLAVTRFSGRRAPERPGADPVTRESYSHEVISHGFWPGGGPVPDMAFYAYAAPEPDGFKTAVVAPEGAYYSKDLSEFLLPYDIVRRSESPSDALSAFLATTYDAGARLGRWDRDALERR